MNYSPELIQLIRCPVSGSALRPMDEQSLKTWNQKIELGQIDSRSGKTVNRPLTGGFINEDSSLIIPVHEGIIVMLDDELIPTSQHAIESDGPEQE